MSADLEWMEDADCYGADVKKFFPANGDHIAVRKAKAICRGCDVIEQCKEYAISMPSTGGVWGATTQRERDTERSARRRAPKEVAV